MHLLTLKFVTDVRDLDYEVVEFHGDLDVSTLPSAEKQIFELISAFKHPYLIFDLTDLKFIHSEGVGFMVSTQMKLKKKGFNLLIFGAKFHVAEIFELVGLGKLIHMFSNITEAIHSIKKDRIP